MASIEVTSSRGKGHGGRAPLLAIAGMAFVGAVLGAVALGVSVSKDDGEDTVIVGGTSVLPVPVTVVVSDNSGLPDAIPLPGDSLIPEGVAWDGLTKQLLISSVAYSSVFNVDTAAVAKWGSAGLQQLFGPADLSIAGVHADTAAAANWFMGTVFPPNPVPAKQSSVIRLDSHTGVAVEADLSGLRRNGAPMLANDAVMVNGVAYVTNSLDGQVFTATYDSATGALAVAEFVYDPDLAFALTDPHFLGLNGIEWDGGANLLLSAMLPAASGGGLYRMPLAAPLTNSKVTITNGSVGMADGIRFNNDRSLLYVVERGTNVVVLSSSDDWVTAGIVRSYCAPSADVCIDGPINPLNVDGDMFVQCAQSIYRLNTFVAC